jgi:hypothetical protein
MSDQIPENMQLKRRCPRLGHDVDFKYCLMNGEEDLPCWKVFDCWWEIFDIRSHLIAILTEAQYNRLVQKKPRNKIESILEIVEKARKRNQGKDQNE